MITDLATHPRPYVRINELAEYLDVSPRTVYYWIEKGAVATVFVGSSRRIPIAEARACIKAEKPSVCNS